MTHLIEPLGKIVNPPPDADLVWITPATASTFLADESAGFQAVSPRMLSHWVHLTIGESRKPADGRGSSRGFSVKDVSIMREGWKLSSRLGLAPNKVRICCTAIEEAWEDVFPEPYATCFKPGRDWGDLLRHDTYLLAYHASGFGFRAYVHDVATCLDVLRKYPTVFEPTILACLSTPIVTTIMALTTIYQTEIKQR